MAAGAGHMRVIVRHLLPNVLPPMIVVASLGFSAAVLSAAALSFLGLGAQPPTAEWGLMLSTGTQLHHARAVAADCARASRSS